TRQRKLRPHAFDHTTSTTTITTRPHRPSSRRRSGSVTRAESATTRGKRRTGNATSRLDAVTLKHASRADGRTRPCRTGYQRTSAISRWTLVGRREVAPGWGHTAADSTYPAVGHFDHECCDFSYALCFCE